VKLKVLKCQQVLDKERNRCFECQKVNKPINNALRSNNISNVCHCSPKERKLIHHIRKQANSFNNEKQHLKDNRLLDLINQAITKNKLSPFLEMFITTNLQCLLTKSKRIPSSNGNGSFCNNNTISWRTTSH
jgi:hypothetical protein